MMTCQSFLSLVLVSQLLVLILHFFMLSFKMSLTSLLLSASLMLLYFLANSIHILWKLHEQSQVYTILEENFQVMFFLITWQKILGQISPAQVDKSCYFFRRQEEVMYLHMQLCRENKSYNHAGSPSNSTGFFYYYIKGIRPCVSNYFWNTMLSQSMKMSLPVSCLPC